MDICSLNFNVTLLDVGENNELTTKGLLRILQEAACIHSSFTGINVNTSKVNGIAWVILNWKLKFFSRPCWNSKLKVNTWSSNTSKIFYYRDFEVFDEKDNLVAIATSKWVLFDINAGTIAKIPEEYKKEYIIVDKHVFDEPFCEKLTAPDTFTKKFEYTILKRDIDTNHHVNNLNYVDISAEVLPENAKFDNIEIMYKHEAKLGDTLNFLYSEQNGESFVSIKNSDESKVHCIIKMY